MKKNQIFALFVLLLCALLLTGCAGRSALNGSMSWPGITAEEDTVYIANAVFVEAVSGGQKLWSYPESANNRISYFAAPAVDDTHVYAGTYTNRLHIINKEDGTLAADIEIGNNKNKVIASPIVADGNVIVVSSGGMVSSYPADSAGESITPNWQMTLSNEAWVKPVYENGTLYVASMDKKMNLLDAKTGELKQSITISGAIMSDPVLADGKLYFSTLGKEVDEMDLASGEIRTLLTTNGEIWAAPLVMGDRLIAADMSGYIYIVDLKTGNPVWTSEVVTTGKVGFIASPIALDEETVLLIAEDGEVMTYDPDGRSLGERKMGQSIYTTPVLLANGNFVISPITDDSEVKSYSRDLKTEDWVYTRSTKAESKSENKEDK